MSSESILVQFSWPVQRFGHVKEVVLDNGSIRYHVEVWDEGRKPFLSRWFNDPVPATDFLERVKAGWNPKEDRVRS